MHRVLVFAAIAFSLFCTVPSDIAANESVRTSSFSVVRASQHEMIELLRGIRSVVSTIEAELGHDHESEVSADHGEEYLALGGHNSEVRFTNIDPRDAFAVAPRQVTRMLYRYNFSSTDTTTPAPISSVEILLDDFDRYVRVTGHSAEQVGAAFRLLSNQLSVLEASFGGSEGRLMGGTLLVLLGALCVVLACSPNVLAGTSQWLALSMGITLVVSVWILPWGKWFPGTLIMPDNATFAESNIAVIVLFGFVVSVCSLSVGVSNLVTTMRRRPARD